MSYLDYTGKQVVVTGGATGIGAALLDLLAELGASDVTVLDLVQPRSPHETSIETDLADRSAVDAAIVQLRGPIDALFSNAGVADTLPPATVFQVNALAMKRLSESLLPQISDGGAIVVTASIAGMGWAAHLDQILELLEIDDWDMALEWFLSRELGAPYTFSKEVAQVFAMKFSHEAMARRVRVNSVCPAPIDTPLLADFRKTMTDDVIDWTLKSSAGRPGTAREVASCLAWLGSPASSYVSGVNLNVDAGFTAALTTNQVDFTELGLR